MSENFTGLLRDENNKLLIHTYEQEDLEIKSAQNRKYIQGKILKWIFIGTLLFSIGCIVAHADVEGITLDKWADSIYITEGIHSQFPYGIRSVHARNAMEARSICKRTVLHKWKDYCSLPIYKRNKQSFLNYLADRYCPPSCDRQGNINWKANMKRILYG